MSTLRPWLDCCREEASAQAEAEARSLWRLPPEAVIPFNHRWEHVQDVVSLARWLVRQTGADTLTLEAAAWLHDVRKMEPRHAIAGANAARQILAKTDFPPARTDAVCDAIRKHEGMFRPPNASPLEPLEAA
ncbi:MAG: HD domain-containing protein, partial [Caldilineaceae bacterium]|nr:HD domain-containing protein [Caldilineaceae bacterium]